jgi:hypothetical protein
MNEGSTAIYIEDSQDCNFGMTITCTGFDTAVKINKSKNLTFKEVTHIRRTQYTLLYASILKILYSL